MCSPPSSIWIVYLEPGASPTVPVTKMADARTWAAATGFAAFVEGFRARVAVGFFAAFSTGT